MNSRFVLIVLTTAAVCAAALITLVWRPWSSASTETRPPAPEHPQVSYASSPNSALEASSAPAGGTAMAVASVPIRLQVSAQTWRPPPQVAEDSEASREDGGRSAAASAPLIPVAFVVAADPEDPGAKVPILMNFSARTLNVSVTARSSNYESSVNVTLGPSARMVLTDSGLTVQRGDEIILHSPDFRDRDVQSH